MDPQRSSPCQDEAKLESSQAWWDSKAPDVLRELQRSGQAESWTPKGHVRLRLSPYLDLRQWLTTKSFDMQNSNDAFCIEHGLPSWSQRNRNNVMDTITMAVCGFGRDGRKSATCSHIR